MEENNMSKIKSKTKSLYVLFAAFIVSLICGVCFGTFTQAKAELASDEIYPVLETEYDCKETQLEIHFEGAWLKYSSHTEGVGNQMTSISLLVKGNKSGISDGWHTLNELSAHLDAWAVQQNWDIIYINNNKGTLPSSDIVAVKLHAGMGYVNLGDPAYPIYSTVKNELVLYRAVKENNKYCWSLTEPTDQPSKPEDTTVEIVPVLDTYKAITNSYGVLEVSVSGFYNQYALNNTDSVTNQGSHISLLVKGSASGIADGWHTLDELGEHLDAWKVSQNWDIIQINNTKATLTNADVKGVKLHEGMEYVSQNGSAYPVTAKIKKDYVLYKLVNESGEIAWTLTNPDDSYAEPEKTYTYEMTVDYNVVSAAPADRLYFSFAHDGKFDAYALSDTIAATNQGENMLLYIEGVENKTDGWYTLNELIAGELVDPWVSQFGLQLQVALKEGFTNANVKHVLFKDGFEFAGYTGNSWGTADNAASYTKIGGLATDLLLNVKVEGDGETKKLSYSLYNPAGSDEAKIEVQPEKTTFNVDESVSADGLVVSIDVEGVKYYVKANGYFFGEIAQVSADTSETGTKTVTVAIGETSVTYEIEVEDTISSVEIIASTLPASVKITVRPDFSNAKIRVNYNGAESVEIGFDEAEYSFDFLVSGDQVLTVKYKGKTATAIIPVIDENPDGGIHFVNGSSVSVEVTPGVMAVRFRLDGVKFINLEPQPLYVVDKCSNALDKIYCLIDEHYKGDKLEVGTWYSLRQLAKIYDREGNPYVGGVSQLADTLIIHLESLSHEVNEFALADIAKLKIEKGFYFCDYSENTWGQLGHTDYSILEGGVLKNGLILKKNIVGTNWLRELAEGDDALTIKSLPSKTVYVSGDKFDSKGLIVHAKYADGYEEDIIDFSPTQIRADMKKIGEQTVTINLFERTLKFSITINEEQKTNSGESGSSSSCGGSIGGIGCAAMLTLIAACALVLKKKDETKN